VAKQIDLNNYRSKASRVFAGRSRGEAVRMAANLNEADQSGEPVEIHIPEDTFSVNSSFFLGMFGGSIRALGEEKFKEKYRFVGKDISRVFEDGVKEALRTSSPLGKAAN
jgi:hypothetical protein